MVRSTHPSKLFAATLALAMAASVALPVLAYACETGQHHTVLASCCLEGEVGHEAPMPCQEDAPAEDGRAPGEHFAACCTSSDLAVVHEATRAESPAPPQIRVLTLVERLWAADEGSTPIASIPADEWLPAMAAGVGLHVLYGALLN